MLVVVVHACGAVFIIKSLYSAPFRAHDDVDRVVDDLWMCGRVCVCMYVCSADQLFIQTHEHKRTIDSERAIRVCVDVYIIPHAWVRMCNECVVRVSHRVWSASSTSSYWTSRSVLVYIPSPNSKLPYRTSVSNRISVTSKCVCAWFTLCICMCV